MSQIPSRHSEVRDRTNEAVMTDNQIRVDRGVSGTNLVTAGNGTQTDTRSEKNHAGTTTQTSTYLL